MHDGEKAVRGVEKDVRHKEKKMSGLDRKSCQVSYNNNK